MEPMNLGVGRGLMALPSLSCFVIVRQGIGSSTGEDREETSRNLGGEPTGGTGMRESRSKNSRTELDRQMAGVRCINALSPRTGSRLRHCTPPRSQPIHVCSSKVCSVFRCKRTHSLRRIGHLFPGMCLVIKMYGSRLAGSVGNHAIVSRGRQTRSLHRYH